jgi:hypothetical protein
MVGTWLRIALLVFLIGAAVSPAGPADARTLVLRGGTVYASPEADPLSTRSAVQVKSAFRKARA